MAAKGRNVSLSRAAFQQACDDIFLFRLIAEFARRLLAQWSKR
jgi:hypothetical protein